MLKNILITLIGLILFITMSCNINESENLDSKSSIDKLTSDNVQNLNLSEPMENFNTAEWEKGNWTNSGFFNCGWNPDNVYFDYGQMVLKLDDKYSHGKDFSSGEYRTKKTFSYGYFETNMIAVKAAGTVTSFFLYTDNPWDEIDVEILGKDTTKVQFNYFVDGVGDHEAVIDLGFDSSTEYHKYGIEYGEGYINWFVDDVLRHSVKNASLPSHPMQIMVNLWPGIGVDGWLGPFNYNGPYYAYYDYILYKDQI